jgi:hypothetical protein
MPTSHFTIHIMKVPKQSTMPIQNVVGKPAHHGQGNFLWDWLGKKNKGRD